MLAALFKNVIRKLQDYAVAFFALEVAFFTSAFTSLA